MTAPTERPNIGHVIRPAANKAVTKNVEARVTASPARYGSLPKRGKN
jgi:hypothetical protein